MYNFVMESSFEEIEGKTHLKMIFPTRKIMLYGGVLMETLIFCNIIWSCVSTFNCLWFIPTISYLACYKGHDRLFNFTMVFWGLFLSVFTLVSYIQYRSLSTRYNVLFLSTGLLISILQPCLAVLDEGNSSNILPIEKVHGIFIITLIFASFFWIFLTNHRFPIQGKLYKYILTGVGLLFCSIAQWFYGENDGIIFNYAFEALFEWTTVAMAVFLPYMYSETYKDIIISTKNRTF